MRLLIKILNLAGLLLAVAWLYKSPDWEPAITSIGLLVVFLGQELFPNVKKSDRDKNLALQFLSDLPSDSRSINFLRDHDIGVPYKSDVLNQMDEFLYNWDDAEHEFSAKSIEKKKKELFIKAKESRNRLSMKIYSHHKSG